MVRDVQNQENLGMIESNQKQFLTINGVRIFVSDRKLEFKIINKKLNNLKKIVKN